MLCPICEDLHREHSRECELEAKAIIQQHKPLTSDGAAAHKPAPPRDLDEVIVKSRKRQMELAQELDRHRANSHAA